MTVGHYLRLLPIALGRAGGVAWALFATWFFYPVLAATSMNWRDAAGLSFYVRGLLIPRIFDAVDMQRAWLGIVAAWLLLFLVTFILTVKFYRRTMVGIPLWPVAFMLVAGLLNFVWWYAKGYFDPAGAIMGTLPCLVMAIMQRVCDRIGTAFVFGDSPAAVAVELP